MGKHLERFLKDHPGSFESEPLIIAYMEILEEHLKKGRFYHTCGVVKTAQEMAIHFGLDPIEAMTAAALHDYAKHYSADEMITYATINQICIDDVMKSSSELLHGYVGAQMVKERFNLNREDVLNAIRFHTIGRAGMSLLEKVIYLADAIEPGRDYPGLKGLRVLCYENLDEALLASVTSTLSYVLSSGSLLHPNSVALYNELMAKLGKKPSLSLD